MHQHCRETGCNFVCYMYHLLMAQEMKSCGATADDKIRKPMRYFYSGINHKIAKHANIRLHINDEISLRQTWNESAF